MLNTKEEVAERDGVGVLVGRFQVSNLTDGHKELFESVIQRHQKTLCIIGLAPIRATKNNPLDFESRRKMIQDIYPNIQIFYITDRPSNEDWSRALDKIISDNIPPGAKATLYGSRDSFINYYSGKYTTKVFQQKSYTSGTKDRTNLAFNTVNSEDFRKGVIWATQNQYPTAFSTVDIAIINKDVIEGGPQLLLGRKENEDKFRLIGGFIDPPKKDPGGNDVFKQNAKRETMEETGGSMEIGELHHIGSYFIDDWRYRNEESKIITTLFYTYYKFGRPVPSDDIFELRWFQLSHFINDEYLKENIVEVHQKLIIELIKKAKGEKLIK